MACVLLETQFVELRVFFFVVVVVFHLQTRGPALTVHRLIMLSLTV